MAGSLMAATDASESSLAERKLSGSAEAWDKIQSGTLQGSFGSVLRTLS